MTDASTMDGNSAERKMIYIGINKNLIMLKLSLFFLYGATSSLLPYLTVHMQSIGLTIEEIALVYLSLPFTTFLAPPVTGFLVDKFGKYKPIVIITFVLNAALHHSLLLIPHQETPGVMPNAYVMRHPTRNTSVEVWWSPCPSRECPEEANITVILDNCIAHCLLKKAHDLEKRRSFLMEMEENENFANKTKTLSRKKKKFLDSPTFYVLDIHPDLGDAVEQLGIEMESNEDDDSVTDFKKRFSTNLLKREGVNVTELEENDVRCGGIVLNTNFTIAQLFEAKSHDCMLHRCSFRRGGPDICPPDFKESDDRTFWKYFFIRFIACIMMTAGVTIMDPIALTMIEKYGGDFGREKIFSSLGMALFSPITGTFIDYNSRGLGYTDYSAAFYTYDILLIIAALTVFLMPLGTKLPADNLFRDLVNIFKIPNVVIFIIFLYFLGNLWGFIESFLFFYLKDLGAPNALLGITVTVGTISSMPFLYGAEKITKKIGHVNIIVIAFFAHAGRLMGYSFIENAWWCFPFEAMESLSVHLMWVAAATYCTFLAPKNLLATLIGVTGMAHFSIGRGSGSFIGGHLIGKVGIRQAFRLMGLAAIVAGSVYSAIHFFWLRKYDIKTREDEDGLENVESEKLKDLLEPKYKDQSTMVSIERLSLMIEYNQIGSLTSLGRWTKGEHEVIKRARSNSIRRGSYNVGMFKQSRGSASKVDLLKSATEMSHSRNSNPHLKNSTGYLSRNNSIKVSSDSTSKLAKSTSLTPVEDKVLDKSLIPDETEEIIYANTKKENILNATLNNKMN